MHVLHAITWMPCTVGMHAALILLCILIPIYMKLDTRNCVIRVSARAKFGYDPPTRSAPERQGRWIIILYCDFPSHCFSPFTCTWSPKGTSDHRRWWIKRRVVVRGCVSLLQFANVNADFVVPYHKTGILTTNLGIFQLSLSATNLQLQ